MYFTSAALFSMGRLGVAQTVRVAEGGSGVLGI